MYFSSYRAKTAFKKMFNNIVEIADYAPNHPARYLRRHAAEDTGRYVAEHMIDAISFYSERDLVAFALSEMPKDGALLEFGVYKGGSTRFIANSVGATRELHAFDSFEGLPETWGGGHMPKGTFSLEGKLPRVPPNCKLHKGWYDRTLPAWLETHHDKVAFLHVDCDLYSSTKNSLRPAGRTHDGRHDHRLRRVLQLSELAQSRAQGIPGVRAAARCRV